MSDKELMAEVARLTAETVVPNEEAVLMFRSAQKTINKLVEDANLLRDDLATLRSALASSEVRVKELVKQLNTAISFLDALDDEGMDPYISDMDAAIEAWRKSQEPRP